MAERVEVLDIDTSSTVQTLNDLKAEIKALKTEFEQTDVTSEKFRDLLQQITEKQQQLTNITKSGVAAQVGSYNELVNMMAKLKTEWRATSDEATRNALGSKINDINNQLKQLDSTIGSSVRYVGDYRGAIKDLRMELAQLVPGTAEYNAKLLELANTTRDYKDQQEAIRGGAQDYGQVISNISGVMAGFTGALQVGMGAMQAMGIESEDAMEMIKQLQGVMAITSGLQAIGDGVKAFGRLNDAIKGVTVVQTLLNKVTGKGTATVVANTAAEGANAAAQTTNTAATGAATAAQWSFNAAVAANPLGAFILVVMAAVAAVWGLVKAVSWLFGSNKDAEQSQEDLKKAQERSIQTADKLTEAWKEQDKALKKKMEDDDYELQLLEARGGTEQQVHDLKISHIQDEIKALQALIKQRQAELTAWVEQQKIQAGMYEFVDAQGRKNLVGTKEQIAKYKELVGQINELKDESLKLQRSLELENAKFETKQRNDIKKRHQDERKAEADHQKKMAQETLNVKKKLRDTEVSMMEEGVQKEMTIRRNQFTDEVVEYKKKLKDKLISEEQYQQAIKILTEKFNKDIDVIKKKWDDKEQADELKLFKENNQKKLNEIDTYSKQAEKKMYEIYEKTGNQKLFDSQSLQLEADVLDKQLAQYESYVVQLQQEQATLQEGSTAWLNVQSELIAAQEKQLDLEIQLTQVRIDAKDAKKAEQEQQFEQSLMGIDMMSAVIDDFAGTLDPTFAALTDGANMLMNSVLQVGAAVKSGEKGWQGYAAVAGAALSGVGQMLGTLAQQQDDSTEEGFEQKKKMEIAAATMNMLGGIVSAWTSAMSPSNAWMTIWGQLAMGTAMSALVATMGGLQIANIKKQTMNSNGAGSSAGSASPSASAMTSMIAPVQYTSEVQGASTEGQVADSRVYVLESDITNTQRKVSTAESEATF